MAQHPPAWRQLLSRSRLRQIRHKVPQQVSSRGKWIVREWLKPVGTVATTVSTTDGTRYFLSSDPLDDIVLRELWESYEPLFYPKEMARLPAESLVLDAGAHHGAYAANTLARYPGFRMVSVEPDPVGFRTLSRNIAINGFQSRCELVEAAITERDGDFLLEQSDEGSWGNSVVEGETRNATARIRGVSLASLLQGRKPDLVKSNCEGGEYTLVPQMLALGLRPKIVVLLVHPKGGLENELMGSLSAAGYEIRPTCTSESHPRFVCLLK